MKRGNNVLGEIGHRLPAMECALCDHRLVPRITECAPRLFWQDLKRHVRLQSLPATAAVMYMPVAA